MEFMVIWSNTIGIVDIISASLKLFSWALSIKDLGNECQYRQCMVCCMYSYLMPDLIFTHDAI